MTHMQRISSALRSLGSVLRNPVKNLEWFVAGMVFIFGILFIVAIPPMQGGDESNHFLRAYQLSQGNIISDHVGQSKGGIATYMQYFDHNVGGSLPKGVVDFTYDAFDKIPQHSTTKMDSDYFKRLASYDRKQPGQENAAFGNTAAWSPVAYLPQLLAIWFGKLINATPLTMMYLARLAGLLFATIAVFFIIRLMPFGKLPLAVIILLPMTISQFAIVSADVTALIFGLLVVALIVHYAFRKQDLSRKDIILLLAVFGILGLVKLSLMPITLIAFALVANRFIDRRKAWLFSCALIGVTLVAGFAWNLLVKDLVIEGFHMSYPQNNYQEQLNFIIHEPWNYARVLFNTFFTANFNYVPTSLIGYFGWADTPMPLLGVVTGFIIIGLSVFISALYDTANIPRWLRWTVVASLAGVAIGTATYMYLFCNAPRDPFAVGIQGRYFIPALGLLPLLFIGGKKIISDSTYRILARRCLYASVVLLVVMTFITFSRFYNVPAIL